MEIQIKFFASLRETLGQEAIAVDCEPGVSIAEIIVQLGTLKGAAWLEALSDEKVLCALNQSMVTSEHLVQEASELAFFPPVTGG